MNNIAKKTIFLFFAICISMGFMACGKTAQTFSSPVYSNTPTSMPELSSSFAPKENVLAATIPLATPPPSKTLVSTKKTLNVSSKPLYGKTIGIDAGHQSKANYGLEPIAPDSSEKKAKVSSGTRGISTKIYEYQLNLKFSVKLQKKLEALGAKVIMTRTKNDVNISNSERAKIMNKNHVDAFIRIHANGNKNHSLKGMFIIVPSKNGYLKKALQAESERLGKMLLREAIKSAKAKNKGLSYRNDQTGINWSKVPVCIIEMGFMTNATEDKLLNSDAYQEKIVDGLANGFINYFS